MRAKPKVNNEIYKQLGHIWWDEAHSGDLNVLRFAMNPVRVAYFRRMIEQARASGGTWDRVLDVGCGGGYLSESFAQAGFAVTGIDPAEESLVCARRHAVAGGLAITYTPGCGERIPFGDASFDIVLCCDVLEHVDAIGPVLCEIARVLRRGGLFFYDTVNRTLASYLFAIKIMQDWQPASLAGSNGHVWQHFVKPRELAAAMASCGLENADLCGISPSTGALSNVLHFCRLARGRMSFKEVGEQMKLRESRSTRVAYMGYAVRTDGRIPSA